MSNVSKVLGKVLEKRLQEETNKKNMISEEQRGFRKGKTTLHNIKELHEALDERRKVLKEERDNKVAVD